MKNIFSGQNYKEKNKGRLKPEKIHETKYGDQKILYLSYLCGDCSWIVVGFKYRQTQIIFVWLYLNHPL